MKALFMQSRKIKSTINRRKKLIFYFILISQSAIILSCSKIGNEEFQKYFNHEQNEFNLENANSFLKQNSEKLDSIVSKYLNQNIIKTIIRRDKSKFWFLLFNNTIEYSIILDNGEIFDFSFSAFDNIAEMNFFEKKFQYVNDSKNLNIKMFLNQNNIEEYVFKELADLIIEFNLTLITKSEDNMYVKLNFEVFEGLFYVAQGKWQQGNSFDSTTELEKINNNWYYFKEIY